MKTYIHVKRVSDSLDLGEGEQGVAVEYEAETDGARVRGYFLIDEDTGSSKLVHFELLVSVRGVIVPLPCE